MCGKEAGQRDHCYHAPGSSGTGVPGTHRNASDASRISVWKDFVILAGRFKQDYDWVCLSNTFCRSVFSPKNVTPKPWREAKFFERGQGHEEGSCIGGASAASHCCRLRSSSGGLRCATPPVDFNEIARQGFNDGFEAARRDVAHSVPPGVEKHPKFRNPPVPPPAVEDYRHGFREGYQAFLHRNAPPRY